VTRFVAIVAPLAGVALYVGLSHHDLQSLIVWILGAIAVAGLILTVAGGLLGHHAPRWAALFLAGWVAAVAVALVLVGLLVCWIGAMVGDQFGSNDPNKAKGIAEVAVAAVIAVGAYSLNALNRFDYAACARSVLSLRYEGQYPKPTSTTLAQMEAPWEALWGSGTVSIPSSWVIPGSQETSGTRTIALRHHSPTAVSRRLRLIREAKLAGALSPATDHTGGGKGEQPPVAPPAAPAVTQTSTAEPPKP
jgi:hypothetical protein